MKASDYVYEQARKAALKAGLPDRESGWVGADAVKRWKTSQKAVNAVEDAVKYGKKAYKKRK